MSSRHEDDRDRPSSGPTRTTKVTRVRTGCLTCRARKVKCDETPGNCKNCQRMVVECKWPVIRDVLSGRKPTKASLAALHSISHPEGLGSEEYQPSEEGLGLHEAQAGPSSIPRLSISPPPPERKRRRHSKNDRDREDVEDWIPPRSDRGESELGVPQLVMAERGDGRYGSGRKGKGPALPRDDLASRLILDQHIEAFFNNVYPSQMNSFIHRGTLYRDIQENRASKRLLLCICTISSRFVAPSEVAEAHMEGSPQASIWSKEAHWLISNADDISIDYLTCVILMARHDLSSGKLSRGWINAAPAIRTALALGLHKELDEASGKNWAELETRRRLLWACYCLDCLISGGTKDFTLLRGIRIGVQLPCPEVNYLKQIPYLMPSLAFKSGHAHIPGEGEELVPGELERGGLLGQFIRITGIRYAILKYIKTLSRPNRVDPWDPTSPFHVCVKKLARWKDNLPTDLLLTPDNIYAHHGTNQLTPLIMLHIWYHQCHCSLYMISLPGFPESASREVLQASPSGWVDSARFACYQAAQEITQTVKVVARHLSNSSFAVTDHTFPIPVYESIRIQIQYLYITNPAVQNNLPGEIVEDFMLLLDYVKRTSLKFRQVRVVLADMQNMLKRHGVNLPPPFDDEDEAPPTKEPEHPFLRRLWKLRQTELATEEEDDIRNTERDRNDQYQAVMASYEPAGASSQYNQPPWLHQPNPVFDPALTFNPGSTFPFPNDYQQFTNIGPGGAGPSGHTQQGPGPAPPEELGWLFGPSTDWTAAPNMQQQQYYPG